MIATMRDGVVTEHKGVVYRGTKPVAKTLGHYKQRAEKLRKHKS